MRRSGTFWRQHLSQKHFPHRRQWCWGRQGPCGPGPGPGPRTAWRGPAGSHHWGRSAVRARARQVPSQPCAPSAQTPSPVPRASQAHDEGGTPPRVPRACGLTQSKSPSPGAPGQAAPGDRLGGWPPLQGAGPLGRASRTPVWAPLASWPRLTFLVRKSNLASHCIQRGHWERK